jgi:tight adherence protein B
VTPAPGGRRSRLHGRPAPEGWCAIGGAVLALLAGSPLPLLAGAAAVPLVRRVLRSRARRAAADRRVDAVITLCTAVAGELRAGRLPDRAVCHAGVAGLGEGGAAVFAAARFGGDVPATLRAAGRLPGADGLRAVAACWQVAADNGAGLATGLDRVADALRAERDQHADLRAQLAGPRSTAAVLALLPVFGLLLGGAMGAHPLQVLFHSTVGLVCLTAGAALEAAGLTWVARLVRRAEGGGL